MSNKLFRGLALLLLLSLVSAAAHAALKPEYRRNGECYLLIGEGPAAMRGIYRLNNPEQNKYFSPPKYLFKPDSSIGFSVDLERKIYTFSEKIVPGYVLLGEPMKRQVLDSGSTDAADYGYHAFIHYDHRSWGKNTTIYRTGPAGRNVKANGGGAWPHFKSAGPGNLVAAPAGNPLPDVPSLPLGIYPGKSWYEIPNGAWYSSWHTKNAIGWTNKFYVVYGDKVEGQPHNWTLYTHTPSDINADAPSYSSAAGQIVAVSYDKKITRQIFAGCVDGCGGASGSGGGVADPMITDLAFMTPIKGNPGRTYFYSRPLGDINYTVTKDKNIYAPPNPAGNPIIGTPASQDTYWIGVSMRNVLTDYVYCIGTNDIRSWYNQATTSSGAGINISAVTVSNQWNQKGGIVFAFDKPGKMVYKFTRYENDPYEPPIDKKRYEGIDVSDLMSLISADANSEIDDIKADGFGSLFFAMTYPSKNVATYDPRQHFRLNQTIRVYRDPSQDPSESLYTAWLIYRQQYGKAVFERSIYNSTPKEIGRKVYAERYYNLHVKIHPDGLTELEGLGVFPSDYVEPILSSWSAQIGNNDGTLTKDDFSYGSHGLYYEYNYGDPGHAKLAVINVPTPPEVLSLADKKSFLDICGPYSDIPVSTDANSTQQDQHLIKPSPDKLSLDTLYYFMVENYPLTTGAYDPNDQPDWDGDGRKGGFISAISNKESSTNGGSVAYRWRTWLVEDMYGLPVYPPEPYPVAPTPRDGTNTGQENFTFFYSPVRGKFIITCQVLYDWYDYDLLNFGDTIDDLPATFRPNVKAVPTAVGAPVLESAASQLSTIINTDPEFKFMQASASQYIDYITEKFDPGMVARDNNFAVVSVVAGLSTDTPPIPSDLIASIERCDGWSPNNKANNAHWKAHSDYHGLVAGKSYFWRINMASQTVLFDDISKSNSSRTFIVNKMQTPEYDGGGTQINTLYVNHRPRVKFDNKGDDLRWMDNDIRLEAYLEYQVPDTTGLPKTIKVPLLASSSKAIAANKPITASTPIDLPPTDPFLAELVIKMSRTVSYDMWVKNKDGVDLFPVRNLPLPFTLYGKTKVLVIDQQKPKILYAFTKPVNLYADAGDVLKVGVGPSPGNPASVSFRLSDNNPWEAVDAVVGITDLSTFNSNYTHNQSPPAAAPTATFNYKPVFAKTLNRKVAISYDRACRLPSGIVKLFSPDVAAPVSSSDPAIKKDFVNTWGEAYVHRYKLSGGSGAPVENRLQKEFQWSKETMANGNELHFATIGYRVPLNFINVHSKTNESNPTQTTLPKGYANNSPGYDAGGVIRPYKFYLSATDSSGNDLGTKQLNIALHPRDVHKPEPFGFMTEFKNKSTTFFPILHTTNNATDSAVCPANYETLAFNEAFYDSNDWTPDSKTGVIKIKNLAGVSSSYFKALPQIGTNIVKDYSSDSANADYVKLVDAGQVPPLFIEDNVEFQIGCGVSDNAGIAVATLSFKYLDSKEVENTRFVGSRWESTMEVADTNDSNDPKIASGTGMAKGLFRGLEKDFPMSIPVTITCEDNALNWDTYPGEGGQLVDVNNPWSDWEWGPFNRGSAKKNARTFRTSIPVYGTNLIIRTIDKGLRNK